MIHVLGHALKVNPYKMGINFEIRNPKDQNIHMVRYVLKSLALTYRDTFFENIYFPVYRNTHINKKINKNIL